MKRIHQYDYDNYVKEIEKLEEELAEVRRYKGEVAIHQGDNWHDNPILYQTELKETALMAKIKKLRDELLTYEVIKERTSDMVKVADILNPDLVKEVDLSDEEREKIVGVQRHVIRFPLDMNMIVNSENNLGFEELLLYRIAYMLISSRGNVDPEDVLLLTPNTSYSEYVLDELSNFIPDNISMKSINEFVNEYLGEKVSIVSESDKASGFKTSEKYIKLIDEFIESYLSGGLVTDDLTIEGEVLFTKEQIKDALLSNLKSLPNYNWATMYFLNKYKSNFDELSKALTERYANIYKQLPFEDPTRKEYVAKSNEICAVFRDKGQKIIKDYFKKLDRKISEIYSLFINSLVDKTDDKNVLEVQSETVANMKKRKYSVNDIAALLYIRYKLTDNDIFKDHVIIAEGQNYDYLMISTLEKIFNKSGFTIFTRNTTFDGYFDQHDKTTLNYDYEILTSDNLKELSYINAKVKKKK